MEARAAREAGDWFSRTFLAPAAANPAKFVGTEAAGAAAAGTGAGIANLFSDRDTTGGQVADMLGALGGAGAFGVATTLGRGLGQAFNAIRQNPNYIDQVVKDAVVDRIGKGGCWMSGTVRRAGDGAPLAGQRIQIWAHTTEGQEHEPQSHGATLTDKDGKFRLEMPQIVPVFGQPHGHLAYDSGEFKTVFLRPVMRSAKDKSLEGHFVLQPA